MTDQDPQDSQDVRESSPRSSEALAEEEEFSNVSHLVNAQFPPTVDGQLARMFKQEWIENERNRKLTELAEKLEEKLTKLTDLAAKLEEQRNQNPVTIATAAAVAAAEVLQLKMNIQNAEPVPDLSPAATTDGWIPVRDEWATYEGFRADMQRREAEAKVKDYTKELAAGSIGCHPVTITRTMKRYHLEPRCWPPSRWPAKQPRALKPKASGRTNHGLASVAAGVVFTWGVLDVLSDGVLDGMVRSLCWYIHHVQGLPM